MTLGKSRNVCLLSFHFQLLAKFAEELLEIVQNPESKKIFKPDLGRKLFSINTLDNENVFIISHKTDMIADKFKNVIKYEKVGNFTKVVE